MQRELLAWLMLPDAPELPDVETLGERPPWHRQAACRGAGPELFFPANGEPSEAARAICAGCPVRRPCTDTAMADAALWGVWGGLGERERRRLRRQAG